jgi:hypothetical protein
MIKARRHAFRKATMRTVYELLVREPEKKRSLAGPGRIWYENIEMDNKEGWNART